MRVASSQKPRKRYKARVSLGLCLPSCTRLLARYSASPARARLISPAAPPRRPDAPTPATMTSADDAERGLADLVLPPPFAVAVPLPAASGQTTRVNSAEDLKARADADAPPPLPANEKAQLVLADEKRNLDLVAPKPAAPAAKPKPKRRASRWTRFKLWYNTYRCAYILFNLLCGE